MDNSKPSLIETDVSRCQKQEKKAKSNRLVMFKGAVDNGSHLFMELTHVQTLTCQKRENGWVSREQWQTLSGFQETDMMGLGNKDNLYRRF